MIDRMHEYEPTDTEAASPDALQRGGPGTIGGGQAKSKLAKKAFCEHRGINLGTLCRSRHVCVFRHHLGV